MTSKPISIPTLRNGQVVVNGQPLQIADLQFLRTIDEGRNAAIFEARDTQLDRAVAVKIWKQRGISRSQQETAKIAKLNHPLFVTTHRFGMLQRQPFAVMELVRGESLKKWLLQEQSVEDRYLIWRLFSRTMSYLYKQGLIHGDPHTGNILVFTDEDGTFAAFRSYGDSSIAIKVADIGTSLFWSSARDFSKRESRILLETASRLFPEHDLPDLLEIKPSLPPTAVLETILHFCRYAIYVRKGNADIIVEAVLEAPYFRLESLLAQVEKFHDSSLREQVTMGLNGHFTDRHYLDSDGDKLVPEAEDIYFRSRDSFLANLSAQYPRLARQSLSDG